MKYVHEGAKTELKSFMSFITKDPQSFTGWDCLHVEIVPAKRGYDHEALRHEIIDILMRCYMEDHGIAFFVEESNIYIFCKDVATIMLRSAAEQLERHITEKTGAPAYATIWPIHSDVVTEQIGSDDTYQPFESDYAAFTRVLLIEDDPVTRWMVRTALKGECTLLTAGTAGAAIESYHQCKPDLVFLDINLPDRNGDTVLADIFKGDPKANIIIFSGQDNVSTMIKMLENGASGFVAKPFTRDRLLAYVRRSAR